MEPLANAARIRATADYIIALRRDLVELFGPGDHSVVGCFIMRAGLGAGRVLLVDGTAGTRHAIYRTRHDEREFDCDLFADAMGFAGHTRFERAGELYTTLTEMHAMHLMPAERERVEHAREWRRAAGR